MGADGEKRGGRFAELKKKCKNDDLPELQKFLKDKHIELRKRITQQMAGSKMKAYTAEDKGKPTIKTLKKEIAIIQTFINQKMNKIHLAQKK